VQTLTLGFVQTVMRRTSLYVGFILVGSYFGDKVRVSNALIRCTLNRMASTFA
jgi:hypothetical protein